MMSATVISRHWARVEVLARQRDAQGRSDARRNRRQAPPLPPPSPPPPSSRGRPARPQTEPEPASRRLPSRLRGRWCWGVAPRVNRGRPTRWCSPRSCSAGASRSIRVLRPGHRHVQPPGGMSWRARRSGTEPRASRVLGRRSILWRKGDQPWAPPAPNCAHEARCAPSAARGEPARQSFVRPNQRIGEAAPTCAHLRPGGALRTSSCRNVSRRGVTLPRENAADIGRWSSSSQPRIAAAASSKI